MDQSVNLAFNQQIYGWFVFMWKGGFYDNVGLETSHLFGP